VKGTTVSSRSIELTRGRRWALAFGLPVLLAVIGYTGLDYVALVGQDTYALHPIVLPSKAKVTLTVENGDLAVQPSRDGRSRLDGTITYSLVRAEVTWSATAQGTVVSGPDCYWVGNCGADLRLVVPPDRALDATLGSGDLTLEAMTGPLKLDDDSGDMVVGRITGTLVAYDGSGDITGTDLRSSSVKATDDSGDVNLSFARPPDNLRVNDSSGDITVSVPAGVAYKVTARASSGSTNIDVTNDPSSKRVIVLNDGSGDIAVVPSRP
jgi:hypothetical protein